MASLDIYSNKILGAAIDMFVKCGLEEKAYEIYKEMEVKYKIKPDFQSTNCIIGYLIKIMKVEDVVEIIKPLIGSDKLQEEIMWTVLLHACSEFNDKDKCYRVYEVSFIFSKDSFSTLAVILGNNGDYFFQISSYVNYVSLLSQS